ncbi:HEPN domain-containing protein [Candidatus Poribacteria bacterium]|nr:HEPN domain-containing protein [Candidatus Poribacteria bacterium]
MTQKSGRRTKQTVYEEISRRMLTDARFLLKNGRWHGAVYLAGYAVECKLKAAVCRYLGVEVLPESFRTHDIQSLIRSAGLAEAVDSDKVIQVRFRRIDSMWRTEIRYAGNPPLPLQGGDYGKQEAENFLDTVRRIVQWLNTILLRAR